MTIETVLYLINLVRNLDALLSFVCFLPIVTFIGLAFFIDDDIWFSLLKTFFKKYSWIWFLLWIVASFIPSEKTMYMMASAHYLKQSTISTKVESIINNKLDEYLAQDAKEKK